MAPRNIEEMKRVAKVKLPTSDLCFVVMSFSNPVLDSYYKEAVVKITKEFNLRCVRVDKEHFDGRITDRIQKNLDLAKIVIVDTTEDKPNCYFEAGYAVAKKKHIIWQRLNAPMFTKQDIAFDIKDYPHILYTTIDDLKEHLRSKIRATLEL